VSLVVMKERGGKGNPMRKRPSATALEGCD
jgi:hypothetical protein